MRLVTVTGSDDDESTAAPALCTAACACCSASYTGTASVRRHRLSGVGAWLLLLAVHPHLHTPGRTWKPLCTCSVRFCLHVHVGVVP